MVVHLLYKCSSHKIINKPNFKKKRNTNSCKYWNSNFISTQLKNVAQFPNLQTQWQLELMLCMIDENEKQVLFLSIKKMALFKAPSPKKQIS